MSSTAQFEEPSKIPASVSAERLQKIQNFSRQPQFTELRKVLSTNELYLVGGSVRDLLEGIEPHDPDFCSPLPATEVLERCSAAGIKMVPTGLAHGTVMAVIAPFQIEITTFCSSAGRSNSQATIEEDLACRDFTVNAIALNIHSGKICDPYSGIADLEQRNLRAVGDAELRFSEDPLRVLRMIRFGPAARRSIETRTLAAARAIAPRLREVAPERIRSELEKLLLSENPSGALSLLQEIGVLEIILPEAIASVGFEQNEYHTQDVWQHTLSVIERCPRELRLRLAALFHDLGKPASFSVEEDGRRHFYGHEHISVTLCKPAMERLRFSHEMISDVSTLVATHMRPLEVGAPGARRLIRDLGPLLEDWKKFKGADATPTLPYSDYERALSRFNALEQEERERPIGSVYSKLAVDGNDLMQLGFKQGPRIGQVLKMLLERVLDEPSLNTKEALLEIARHELSPSSNSSGKNA